MENIIFQIHGRYAGQPFGAEMYQGGEHPLFTLRWQEDEGQLHIRLIPKLDEGGRYGEREGLILDSVSLTFPWECNGEGETPETVFMNGYQSWTDSHEHFLTEKEHVMSGLLRRDIEKYHLDQYGDYNFTQLPQGAGQFHGFTYCYFRKGERYRLLGSLSERAGYTVFYYNGEAQQMRVEKDCNGLEVTGEWNVFDLIELTGEGDAVFDRYFEQMGIRKPKSKPMTGYTSWYHHFQNISQKVILDNLNAIQETGQQWDVFQIDDGYQTFVGDWLDVQQEKFPEGLEPIVQKIHDSGMKAGLWLAPFVCEERSRCYQEHPDWVVRDSEDRPLCAGSNWGGFYPLDLELEPVREHLRQVFHQVLEVWDFDLVKLDFLYAACIQPTREKTRGQLMCEAMDFLRELVGDKLILGCGVPLGPAFGKVDYCRIGSDVGLNWNGTVRDRLLHRERVSTKNAVGNTIYRRHLDGRAFWNDPDVYLLRDDNMKMSWKERSLLAQVNGLFGSLLFTSDNVREYDEEKKSLCREIQGMRTVPRTIYKKKNKTIVEFEHNGEKKILSIKL